VRRDSGNSDDATKGVSVGIGSARISMLTSVRSRCDSGHHNSKRRVFENERRGG